MSKEAIRKLQYSYLRWCRKSFLFNFVKSFTEKIPKSQPKIDFSNPNEYLNFFLLVQIYEKCSALR